MTRKANTSVRHVDEVTIAQRGAPQRLCTHDRANLWERHHYLEKRIASLEQTVVMLLGIVRDQVIDEKTELIDLIETSEFHSQYDPGELPW